MRNSKKMSWLARLGAMFIALMSLLAIILTIFIAITEGFELIMIVFVCISLLFTYSSGYIVFTGKPPPYLKWAHSENSDYNSNT